MPIDQKQSKFWNDPQGAKAFTEQSRETKQKVVKQEADYLMRKHGLRQQGWRFQFDHAKRRAGQCRYDTKTISISKYFTEEALASEIIDTILHEIAHALTPKRGHDRVWQQVALSIGCNGKRCHSLQFAPSKYIQQCVNQCWTRKVHRRRKNLICRFCQGEIIYTLSDWSE